MAHRALRPLDATTAPAEPLPVTIMQFGAGAFLRAFVDQMVQRANDAGVMRAGIVAVRATDSRSDLVERMRAQDSRFHVLLRGVRPDGAPFTETTLVTAIQQTLSCYEDYDAYLQHVLNPQLRIVVSNTTEAGIVYQSDDLAATPPRTFPGKVAAALYARWRHLAGDPAGGLAFLPCELIEANGTTLRALVLRHAREAGLPAQFQDWVSEHCTFYDTLVDRIVPGFPQAEIDAVQAELGFRDDLVVVGEHYGSWAIAGPPGIETLLPLDRAGLGVRFLADITEYREAKVRLLNGAHTAMTCVGLTLGLSTVLAADRDPLVGGYTRALLEREVLPTIGGDPVAAADFARELLARFANPALEHRLADIALNSLAKWRTRNLPVLLDRWAQRTTAPLTVASLACLVLRYVGALPGGDLVQDDAAEVAAVRAGYNPADLEAWLAGVLAGAHWNLTPDQGERLAKETSAVARSLLNQGPRAVLRHLLTD